MNIKTAIQAKLEERRAAEYLKKCKAATAAALAALADEAEETGQDLQAVLAMHLGKPPTKGDARRSQTEGEQALALLRQSKAPASTPAKPTASTPAKAAPAKPASRTPRLDKLATLTGAARNEFYQKHRDEIFSEHAHITNRKH